MTDDVVEIRGWYQRDPVTGNFVPAKPPARFTTDELVHELVQTLERKARDKATIESQAAEIERLREALSAIRQSGVERDVKWAGMNAHDIARQALTAKEPKG